MLKGIEGPEVPTAASLGLAVNDVFFNGECSIDLVGDID